MDSGRVVWVIVFPAFIGWVAKACAPISVNAKYFPEREGLDP
jgi:hypothetical protein